MDQLRQWLSEDIAECELSILGREVLQLIRRDRVSQFPRITDNVPSSNSRSSASAGLSNQPLNTGNSEEICEINDIATTELPRDQNGRTGLSSADEGSLEEDEPSEVDNLLQIDSEAHDCKTIQNSAKRKSNEILNLSDKLLTQSSEVDDHADRAFECSAEGLVLSGVISPEELQDVNNIIAETEIYVCDMDEFTKPLQPDGKNIEQTQDQYITEVLGHTATNCLSLQLTTNQHLSKNIHNLNDGSVSSVCDVLSDNKTITDACSLNGEIRSDMKDLNTEAENVNFTEESAEGLVLSGVINPEELQDINKITAETEIFVCDTDEFTKPLEPDGKNIEQTQDQYITEVLGHTATNCLSLQLTSNQNLLKNIHNLNDGSVSSVCDVFSDNKTITDICSLNDEIRSDVKDLTTEAGNVNFTEERNILYPSPGSRFYSTTEQLEDSSDKESAHSETCQGSEDEGVIQELISVENGIRLSNTQHLGVRFGSERLNVCENKYHMNSLTEVYQESPSVFEDSPNMRNQLRPVKHFVHNDTGFNDLYQTERNSIKMKKFKRVMKQLNIKDMFMKRTGEDKSFGSPPITNSGKKKTTCVLETKQKHVSVKRSSSASDVKLRCDSVKNSSMSSKNHTLENMVHVKKHKNNSFNVCHRLKSFPFPEVKPIDKRRKEMIGNESVYLDDITASELEDRLYRAEPVEMVMTLVYRGGYCDLNKPAESTVSSVHKAAGVLLSIKVAQSEVPNFYYISFDENDWKEIATPKQLLKTILNHSCRKICFCAQDLMMDIIKRFQFSRSEVCLKWILLDPLIGCWLLNPDKSFHFFSEVTEALGLEGTSAVKDELNQTKLSPLPQALEKLSLCAMLLYEKLDKCGLWRLFLDIEMKLVSILSVMETRGICTNIKKLQEMQTVLHEHLCNLQEQAYKEAGKQFQMNSPQQLRNILYDDLQLDRKSNIKVRETAKLGQKSTSEHMLSLLKSWHPLPGTVLQYRHLQKIKSTFIDGVLQQVVDGKVYPSWGQHCAATGRITSSNPNLQAVPKQPVVLKISSHEEHSSEKILYLRSPYHARDGYSLVSADFQHIELRMLAHLSRDPVLKEILQKSDDVFTSMSRIWLRKTQGTIETEDREKTKRIVYAIMYGAGPAKLSEFLSINHSEASTIINSFLAHFPAIKKFSNAVAKECKAKECLHTITGRHRLFPNISSGNNGLKSYTERQAVNFLMQGSAADICKCAMIRTELEFLKHPELDVHLLIQIHDELVWEVKDEHFDTVKGIIRKSMEDCSNISEFQIQISVPLPVIVKKGKEWANMQEI